VLERIEGRVAVYRSITKTKVQFELQGVNKIIELTVSEPWVINRGDNVVVAGEIDEATGKFVGYAYRNTTKGVFGKFDAHSGAGVIFIIASIVFCWGIFPLFLHLPAGIKMVALGKKVNLAADIIQKNEIN